MSILHALLLGAPFLLPLLGAGAGPTDPARLRELLRDHQQPTAQSQAALLLVQNRSADAQAIVHQGLRQTERADVFLALAAALRLQPESRFTEDLLAALASSRPLIRQAAVETLAVLADDDVVQRLQTLVTDAEADLAVRQAAVVALGLSGRKSARGCS